MCGISRCFLEQPGGSALQDAMARMSNAIARRGLNEPGARLDKAIDPALGHLLQELAWRGPLCDQARILRVKAVAPGGLLPPGTSPECLDGGTPERTVQQAASFLGCTAVSSVVAGIIMPTSFYLL